MEIAILGAGGFIGSHLVEHLAADDQHHVMAVDITRDKLDGIPERNFTFWACDVRRNTALVDAIIRDTDLVVDLIAHANPSLYVTSPLEVFELNFLQNLDIAKRCMAHGKRLIQYSSAEVYGKAAGDGAYSEDRTDFVVGPVHKQRWIYASSKALLERLLYAYGMAGELEYTILRPFNFIGSRIDYLVPAYAIGGPRVFPHFISALSSGGPIRLVNGGHVHRAFLHIDDGMTAFQAVLDNPDATRNEVFNVGNPANNVTIRELAVLMIELYEEIMGTAAVSQVVDVSGDVFYGAGYEDSDRLPPDISKLRSLGWAPQYDLRTTIRDAMRAFLTTPQCAPRAPSLVDARLYSKP